VKRFVREFWIWIALLLALSTAAVLAERWLRPAGESEPFVCTLVLGLE
jgi:hypothetical protein